MDINSIPLRQMSTADGRRIVNIQGGTQTMGTLKVISDGSISMNLKVPLQMRSRGMGIPQEG